MSLICVSEFVSPGHCLSNPFLCFLKLSVWGDHLVFIFDFLTHSADTLQSHPYCHKLWTSFTKYKLVPVFYHSWVVFHCASLPQSLTTHLLVGMWVVPGLTYYKLGNKEIGVHVRFMFLCCWERRPGVSSGPSGSSIYDVLRSLSFPVSHATAHQQYLRISFPPCPCQHFLFPVFVDRPLPLGTSTDKHFHCWVILCSISKCGA